MCCLVFCFVIFLCCVFFFFFKQKTAYEMRISDWSSDVCSSDLHGRTRLGWIREWPEAPSAANLKGIIERLDAVRGIGIAADRARRIHAARYAVLARPAGIVTAPHLRLLDRLPRPAMPIPPLVAMGTGFNGAAFVLVSQEGGAG